eukprot:GEMP01041663.1.p3 GENE.GEMP01041663.1~~GEMP01041663.1.p3  ORF type:complete len:101 (-),score=8.02 GEMP01041663.1:1336-1638(-)
MFFDAITQLRTWRTEVLLQEVFSGLPCLGNLHAISKEKYLLQEVFPELLRMSYLDAISKYSPARRPILGFRQLQKLANETGNYKKTRNRMEARGSPGPTE